MPRVIKNQDRHGMLWGVASMTYGTYRRRKAMIGESIKETHSNSILLPAQICGWKKQLRIDRDRSCYLHGTTAENWQTLAKRCENRFDPQVAFEAEVRRLYPDLIIHKSAEKWCVMPLGEWTGMPRIHLDIVKVPLYEV